MQLKKLVQANFENMFRVGTSKTTIERKIFSLSKITNVSSCDTERLLYDIIHQYNHKNKMKKPPSFWATFELTNFKLLRIFSEVTSLVLEILRLKSTIKPLSILEKPKILVTVLTQLTQSRKL